MTGSLPGREGCGEGRVVRVAVWTGAFGRARAGGRLGSGLFLVVVLLRVGVRGRSSGRWARRADLSPESAGARGAGCRPFLELSVILGSLGAVGLRRSYKS